MPCRVALLPHAGTLSPGGGPILEADTPHEPERRFSPADRYRRGRRRVSKNMTGTQGMFQDLDPRQEAGGHARRSRGSPPCSCQCSMLCSTLISPQPFWSALLFLRKPSPSPPVHILDWGPSEVFPHPSLFSSAQLPCDLFCTLRPCLCLSVAPPTICFRLFYILSSSVSLFQSSSVLYNETNTSVLQHRLLATHAFSLASQHTSPQ